MQKRREACSSVDAFMLCALNDRAAMCALLMKRLVQQVTVEDTKIQVTGGVSSACACVRMYLFVSVHFPAWLGGAGGLFMHRFGS